MHILLIGGGAREDALSWRLAQSPSCDAIFHAPGNAGTATRGENLGDVSATDARKILDRAKALRIDLVVLGPETAIAAGVADRLRDAGIAVFGPNRAAGRLETSKVFAKRFMERHGIPTARFKVAHSLDQAKKMLEDWRGGVVVKADGLAAGKGVVVCDDVAAACDYKRAGDRDEGPNTGGMGAYSPPANFPADMLDRVRESIVARTLRGLLADGEQYRGVLYIGLMLTPNGPSVIEFNVRWGDPETQVLMPRITGDFARYLKSAADGALDIDAASFSSGACVGVTLATNRYPYENTAVAGLPAKLTLPPNVAAFWGTSTKNGETVSSPGGRVLTVAANGADVAEARSRAYAAIDGLKPQFPAGTPLAYRSDIGLPSDTH
ncbi:MAG: phosphoribosylamine--glycine ligase [Candidatus Velthaea sp.]